MSAFLKRGLSLIALSSIVTVSYCNFYPTQLEDCSHNFSASTCDLDLKPLHYSIPEYNWNSKEIHSWSNNFWQTGHMHPDLLREVYFNASPEEREDFLRQCTPCQRDCLFARLK